MDVLVISKHPFIIHLTIVAGNTPMDVSGIRVSQVLFPRVIIFRRLELGFREEDIDLVDLVFLAPSVFDLGYPVFVRIGLEVERREVPLDEAGTGDERTRRVV